MFRELRKDNGLTLTMLIIPLLYIVTSLVLMFVFPIWSIVFCLVIDISEIIMFLCIILLVLSRIIEKFHLNLIREAAVLSLLIFSLAPQGMLVVRTWTGFWCYAIIIVITGLIMNLSGFLALLENGIKNYLNDQE